MIKEYCKKGALVVLISVCFVIFTHISASAAGKVIRFAHEAMIESPWGITTEKFREEVEKRTEGRVKVKVFYGGSLAGASEAIQMVKIGTAEMYMDVIGTWGTAMFSPLLVFDMPFIFKDTDHIIAVGKSPIMKKLADEMVKKTGVRILGTVTDQQRVIMSNKPIRTPDDMKGLKIRSAEIATNVAMYKALGALPTTIPWGELYTSLATKIVEGMAAAPRTGWQYKFYEVLKYMNLTYHQSYLETFCINEKFLKSLEPRDQKAVVEAWAVAEDYGNKTQKEKFFPDHLKKVKEHGMELIEVDRAAFEEKLKDFHKQFVGKLFSEELYNSIKSYKY
ncbi:MAG: TRAP transporter substrate-binding protein [Deltaproteobacteria bacterium]|nr:TRAP transporter substrate-binding protein [Deltaproteobacteria bacterium]